MSAPVLNDDGRAVIFDRVTREVLTCSVATATENVDNGKGRYVHGADGEPLDEVEAEAVAEAPIPLSEDEVLPLPAADQASALTALTAITAERDVWQARAVAAEAEVVSLQEVVRLLTEQVNTAPAAPPPPPEADEVVEVDELADARTEAGDSPEKLEKIEAEVDAANGKVDPLDHDADGKKGGAKRSPEEEAERAELFKFFKDLDIKVFAGSTTEKLREKKAKLEADTAP